MAKEASTLAKDGHKNRTIHGAPWQHAQGSTIDPGTYPEKIDDNVAKQMIDDGNIVYLAHNLHRANKLNSAIAQQLIGAGFHMNVVHACDTNPETFDIDPEKDSSYNEALTRGLGS